MISQSYLWIYEKAEAFDLSTHAYRRPQAWGADMTTTIAAHDPVEKDAGHDDVLLAVAKVNALACRGDTVLVDLKPRWRLTEEEIVRAAITVILVALVAVIGVAAGAILTIV
ncbi:hypothetical protein [Mycobacterium sp. 852002-40037_SCH5390672]|uniref:hypothetical protein n=1 Tax=Mycobacterium sp. 852002-40037_SCH5390672 TaxID=1834089 RepID=UPI001E49800C|nr:hypothetical protein [Mycobacterium sp. 852002-40037_SCH5390672]